MQKIHCIIKKIILFMMIAVIIASLSISANAFSYQYNETDNSVAAPDGYEVSAMIKNTDINGSLEWAPTDIYIDSVGEVHLLDQENGCVYVFDADLNYKRTVIFKENGEEVILSNLNGLCVKREKDSFTYYVADTDNKCVFFADKNGNITRKITKPATMALSNATFVPTKVAFDSNNNLYVLCSGLYQGVVVFSNKDNYNFMTFLGGNNVESTASVLADYFWKQIFNKTQKASMRRYVPVPISNFTLDKNDNLYSVTNKSSKGINFENEIKKFNAKNVNILKQQDWGDKEIALDSDNLVVDTSYVDVAIGDDEIISALDANLCRVAVFTVQGDRLFTFGEKNIVNGSFSIPVAIEMYHNSIYVVDSDKQSIIKFDPNEYGELVLKAAKLYSHGEYDKASPIWKEVIKKNSACLLAFDGLGKQYINEKNYKKAMEYFKKGSDRKSYSEAFELQRSINLQKAFPIIAALLILAFIALIVFDIRLKDKSKKMQDLNKKNFVEKIFYAMFHPCEGGAQLARKVSATKTLTASLIIVIIWFLAEIIKWCFSGFIYNTNVMTEFNIWLQIAKTFGLFILWVSCMLLVSSLLECSGRFSDIVIVSATALIPYIISIFLYTIMSNCLSLSEGSYISLIQVFAVIWSVVILWGGLREINELTFSKTLVSVIFAVFGMALVIFMLILLWSLLQQFISFAFQIIIELRKMIA